jgi:hypothetical protein
VYISEENYYHIPNNEELRVYPSGFYGRQFGRRPRRRFRPGIGFFPGAPFYPWWFFLTPRPRPYQWWWY